MANDKNRENKNTYITDGMALATKPSNEDLVVLLDKVEATISGDKGGDLLAVLDELHTHGLADGRVGLLGLDADLLQHNPLGMGRALEGIGLQPRAEIGLFVLLVRPSVDDAGLVKLSCSANASRLSATHVFFFKLVPKQERTKQK